MAASNCCFRMYFRATQDRNYDFATSYSEVPDLELRADRPQFPKDMMQFLNTSPMTSATFFIFRDGILPIYDDPANKEGGEYSVYFEPAKMRASTREIVLAFLGGKMLRETAGAPETDINGVAIIPKHNNHVTVKIWVHSQSTLRGKLATEIFRPEFEHSWKLRETIYLPFNREHVVMRSGNGGRGRGKIVHR